MSAKLGWVGAVVLILTVGGLGVPIAAAHGFSVQQGALRHSVSNVSSSNWAGYAVTSSKNSVTDVRGSWLEPKIVGTCPLLVSQYSSFWVGIDGYSSSTVEQTGTDSDCQLGSAVYYAWYEFYPHASVVISTLTISPGDKMLGEVHWTGTAFALTLDDVTTGHNFTKSGTVSGAQRDSAEWITEAPSSSSGILPLADFGTSHWGGSQTGIKNTCQATIGGVTQAIGKFANVHRITMINLAQTATKASPSGLGVVGAGFTVKWVSAGP
ncbi:MAG TPA: G1 family glutamic endopeptidase [Thermoplasmata archaeon]|nr:G1 family glutamic endopeptidase [Thermoplasmata archaeon]